MKLASIFLAIALVITVIGTGILYKITESQLNEQKAQIATLNDTNTRISNENIKLMATSNLKSFENVKALERFLKGSTTIRNSDPDGYASESCILLMREARESGYFMGITAINTTDESIYDAIIRRNKGATDIQWHVFNIAVVSDSDLYLIDSQEAENYIKLSTISGDFSEYNKVDGLTDKQINKLFQSTTTVTHDRGRTFGDAVIEMFPILRQSMDNLNLH